ncbi:hypothetical protein GEMRC1_004899 [Eukaryota sp. GEM-RC1]
MTDSAHAPSVQAIIEDLRNEDEFIRNHAMNKLSTIAIALGYSRTREDLLTYLLECTDDDSDTVLLSLATQLGCLVDYVGGPTYAFSILPVLSQLLSQEEVTVRNAASTSFSKIVSAMPSEHISEHVIPLIDQLYAGFFTTKASICNLLPVIFSHCDSSVHNSVLVYFQKLTKDGNPMVRRSAIKSMPTLITSVSESLSASPQLLEIYRTFLGSLKQLSEDEQDSVRLLGVEVVGALASVFAKLNDRSTVADFDSLVVLAKAFCSDRSWRVRYVCGDCFEGIVRSFAQTKAAKLPLLVREFRTLLTDVEQEVRAAAANRIIAIGKAVPPEVCVSELVPQFRHLANDDSAVVRATFAPALLELCEVLPSDVVKKELLPLHKILLRDSSADVRLAVISHLDAVYSKFSGALNEALIPAVAALSGDNSWRIRLKLIEQLNLLAHQFEPEFFKNNLLTICFGGLSDIVHAVREASAVQLAILCKTFGDSWAMGVVYPPVVALKESKSYLLRISMLKCLSEMALVLSQDVVAKKLLPLAIDLADDRVPNVRFNAVKTLEVFASKISSSSIDSFVYPLLKRLSNDDVDYDVRDLANTALKNC